MTSEETKPQFLLDAFGGGRKPHKTPPSQRMMTRSRSRSRSRSPVPVPVLDDDAPPTQTLYSLIPGQQKAMDYSSMDTPQSSTHFTQRQESPSFNSPMVSFNSPMVTSPSFNSPMVTSPSVGQDYRHEYHSPRQESPLSRHDSSREYTSSRHDSSREYTSSRHDSSKEYTSSRHDSSREFTSSRHDSSKEYTSSRHDSSKEYSSPRQDYNSSQQESVVASPLPLSPVPTRPVIQAVVISGFPMHAQSQVKRLFEACGRVNAFQAQGNTLTVVYDSPLAASKALQQDGMPMDAFFLTVQPTSVSNHLKLFDRPIPSPLKLTPQDTESEPEPFFRRPVSKEEQEPAIQPLGWGAALMDLLFGW